MTKKGSEKKMVTRTWVTKTSGLLTFQLADRGQVFSVLHQLNFCLTIKRVIVQGNSIFFILVNFFFFNFLFKVFIFVKKII